MRDKFTTEEIVALVSKEKSTHREFRTAPNGKVFAAKSPFATRLIGDLDVGEVGVGAVAIGRLHLDRGKEPRLKKVAILARDVKLKECGDAMRHGLLHGKVAIARKTKHGLLVQHARTVVQVKREQLR